MGKIRTMRIAHTVRSQGRQGDSIGLEWYAETRDSIDYFFDSNASLFAGFLASTSANATVKANLSLALKAYRQWSNGEEFTGYMGQVKTNLKRTLEGLPLNGKKIESFRQAMLGNDNAVVIDRWILRYYGEKKSLNPERYDALAEKMRLEAKSVNLSPCQFQAKIWVESKRKLGDVSKHTDRSFGNILKSRGIQQTLKF